MKTKRDLSRFQARVVMDDDEIDRLRWFQEARYAEAGLQAEVPSALPFDPLTQHSTYFGVYEPEGDILATARITASSQTPELFKYHGLFPEVEDRFRAVPHRVAELSRLATASNSPRFDALLVVCREFLRHGLRHPDGLLLVASVEEPFVRILRRVAGIPVEVIGPPIDEYGDIEGRVVPVLIDTVRSLEAVNSRETPFWEYFSQDLYVDPTIPIRLAPV